MADFEVDLGAAAFDILNSIEFEVDDSFVFQRPNDDFIFTRER